MMGSPISECRDNLGAACCPFGFAFRASLLLSTSRFSILSRCKVIICFWRSSSSNWRSRSETDGKCSSKLNSSACSLAFPSWVRMLYAQEACQISLPLLRRQLSPPLCTGTFCFRPVALFLSLLPRYALRACLLFRRAVALRLSGATRRVSPFAGRPVLSSTRLARFAIDPALATVLSKPFA